LTKRSREPHGIVARIPYWPRLEWTGPLEKKWHSDLKELCKEYYSEVKGPAERGLANLLDFNLSESQGQLAFDSLIQELETLLRKKGHPYPTSLASEVGSRLVEFAYEIRDNALLEVERELKKRAATKAIANSGDVIHKTRRKVADTEILREVEKTSKAPLVVGGELIFKTIRPYVTGREGRTLYVVIPAEVRQRLGLDQNTPLYFKVDKANRVILEKVPIAEVKHALSEIRRRGQ
jgi:AbrB family looped-hinge helix DNA binding protein